MKRRILALVAILATAASGLFLSSCDSTNTSMSMSVGYGFGISDPYFYDPFYHPGVIVPPPRPIPPRPGPGARPRPLPGRL